jgi:hypothetical protein
MQVHIRQALEALLKSDTSISDEDRKRILKAEEKTPAKPDRVLSRREAADRFGRCGRTLDNWSKRGLLKKWQLPGMSRATGFRESEVAALLEMGGGVSGAPVSGSRG